MNNQEFHAKLRNHFKVGNVVESYGKQPDLVVELEIGEDIIGGWRVWVQEILEDGSLGRLRWHSTTPNEDNVLFENNKSLNK